LTVLGFCLPLGSLAFNQQLDSNINIDQKNNKIMFVENKGQMQGSDQKSIPFVLFKARIQGFIGTFFISLKKNCLI